MAESFIKLEFEICVASYGFVCRSIMSVVDKVIVFSNGFDCDNTIISNGKTGTELFVWKANY